MAQQTKTNPAPADELRMLCAALPGWLQGKERTEIAAASPAFPLVCMVHGIGPLLYQVSSGKLAVSSEQLAVGNRQLAVSSEQLAVSSLPISQSPSLPTTWLADQYTLNQQRMSRFHEELHDILALFARHGVDVMPLKGAILSISYYEDPALRPMSDLDLLVRPEHFTQAAVLLGQLGYEPESRNWKHIELSKPNNRQVISTEGEHPDNPRRLDLHAYCHEMFAGPRVDLTEGMWANATTGTLLGQPAWLPHPDWLWLHLLLHTSGNIWGNRLRLLNLVDLVRVGMGRNTGSVSSDQLSVTSEQSAVSSEQLPVHHSPFALHSPVSTHPSQITPHAAHVEARFIYLGARLLQKVFPEAVPAAWLDELARQTPRRLRAWAEELDLFTASYLGRQVARPYRWKLTRFYQARPRDLAHILRFLLLPNDDTPFPQNLTRSLHLAAQLLRKGSVDG